VGKLKVIIKLLLKFIFLPFYSIGKILESKKNVFVKTLGTLFLIVFFLPIWSGILLIGFLVILGNATGYPIEVVGNSMLPSLTTHSYIRMYTYPGFFGFRKVQRGDIVTFADTNESDPSKDFIKRVIALPGDTVVIKDQSVYLNKQILNEPYIASPKSTFGGVKINDCKAIKIPNDKVLALGDNRKLSKDSREIGLVSIKDISRIIPYGDQKQYSVKWRDMSKDKDLIGKSNLDVQKYIEQLNKIREEKSLKPLKLNEKLNKSANLRAQAMLKYDDFSWEATKSGYPMWKSMADAGYYNIVYGEYPILGYYNAEELIAYEKEYSNVINFFMNKDYQDIGISSYKGDLNGCPTNIIIQQSAGYVPPNYSQATIEGWNNVLNRLREIQPSWQRLKQNSSYYDKYRADVDRINEIISIRITNIDTVVTTMKAGRWLSSGLDSFTRTGDTALFNEQESLAKKLNNSK